jgi:hypothetical protein
MNDIATPVLAMVVIGLAITLLLVGSAGQRIVTDEAFKVVSDTSNYSCIVSEIDNDLSLDCLKVK